MAILCMSGIAQLNSIRPLTIGDTVPDIFFDNIINYPRPTASLSDFKKDLLIIDFWATYCVLCVKSLPHFVSLQQKFGNRLQFLLTTSQDSAIAAALLKRLNINLPSLVNDKNLQSYFPHIAIPHEVWVKDNKVIAITDHNQVTEENIRKVLDDKGISFVQKKDNLDYDINKPLLIDGNGGTGQDLLYHSIITGYLDGIRGGGGADTDSMGRFKFRAIGKSVLGLYQAAFQYDNALFLHINRSIIEVKEKDKLHPPTSPVTDTAVRKYFYSYEIILPKINKKNISTFMVQDLNRYFGAVYNITCTIEKRLVTCWVLKKIEPDLKLAPAKGNSSITDKDSIAIWQNQPFSEYFYALTNLNSKQLFPLIDESGIGQNISLPLPLVKDSLEAVNKTLEPYGLHFTKEPREIEMLIIKNQP